jgi:hypothetical protein
VSAELGGILETFLALTGAAGLELRDSEQADGFFSGIFVPVGADEPVDFWAEVDLEVQLAGRQVTVEARFPLPTPAGSIHPLELAEAYQVIDGWLRRQPFQVRPEVRFAGSLTRQAELLLDEFYLRWRWQLLALAEDVWTVRVWHPDGPGAGWREAGRWAGLREALEPVAQEVAAAVRRLGGEDQALAVLF